MQGIQRGLRIQVLGGVGYGPDSSKHGKKLTEGQIDRHGDISGLGCAASSFSLAKLDRERADGRSRKRTTWCGCHFEARSGRCGRRPGGVSGHGCSAAVPPKAKLESTLVPSTAAMASLVVNIIVTQHFTLTKPSSSSRRRKRRKRGGSGGTGHKSSGE